MSNNFTVLSYRHGIFTVFIQLFRLQIQFFTNNRHPNGFMNVMAFHIAVFATPLCLHLLVFAHDLGVGTFACSLKKQMPLPKLLGHLNGQIWYVGCVVDKDSMWCMLL